MTFNQRLYATLAAGYDEDPPFFTTAARELVRRTHLPAGTTVVDLAAGTGAVTVALRAVEGVGPIAAVDASSEMLARLAARRLDGLTTVVADLGSLPFRGNAFDHAVSGFAMHVLADRDQAATEIARVLSPGGTFTWSVPGTHPDTEEWAETYRALYAQFRERLTTETPAGMRPPEEPVEAALERAGLDVVDDEQVTLVVPVGDAEGYWAWTQTHGTRWITDALPAADADELHARVVDSLERLHPTQGRDIVVAPRIVRMRRR